MDPTANRISLALILHVPERRIHLFLHISSNGQFPQFLSLLADFDRVVISSVALINP